MSVSLQLVLLSLPFFFSTWDCIDVHQVLLASSKADFYSFSACGPLFGGPSCFHSILWFSQRSNIACYVVIYTTIKWSGFLKNLHGQVRYLPVCQKKKCPRLAFLKTLPKNIPWDILLNSVLIPCGLPTPS